MPLRPAAAARSPATTTCARRTTPACPRAPWVRAPAEVASEFKSSEYDCCATCAKLLEPERDPAWDAGDAGCGEFFAYLLVSAEGDWYPGHTRSLRIRLWLHEVGRCRSTQGGDYRLVWFQTFPTRAEAAARELELKRLVVTDPYAVLDLVFAFQDRVALVRPMKALG